MKKKYDLERLQNNIQSNFDIIENETDFPSHFYQSFYEGRREIYQKEQSQIKLFDEKWIRTIESYYPSLVTITKRLKSTLKYEDELLLIEKTKKVGPTAIRHLSSHSELIRESSEEGEDDIMPTKVLSSQSEIEYGIYENRFVMTLIGRLHAFILERIKIIKEELEGQRDIHLSYDTAFQFSDNDYELKFELKQKERINKRKPNEHNVSVYERAEHLFRLISHLNNSEFMRIMKKYKPVAPPIMKTQIILKNPDFKNAYLLWLFLDKYYILEYQLNAKVVNKRFSRDYQKQIDQAALLLFSSFFYNDHEDTNGASDGKVKYRVKKAMIRSAVEDDIEIDPYVYEIEPQVANEYFLEKNRALFKKQLEISKSEKPTYTLGLKNALVQNLKITNDLYASFFEIDQDVDVFQRLVVGKDPIEALDQAIHKHKIAKAIREVKEKDYRESVKLEKKWHQEIHQKTKTLLSFEYEQQTKSVKDRIEKIRQVDQEALHAKQMKLLKDKDVLISKQKTELNEYTKKLQDELIREKAKIRLKSKKALKKLIEQEAKKTVAKKNRLQTQFIKTRESLENEHIVKKTKLKDQNKNRLANETQLANQQLHVRKESVKKHKNT